MNRFLFRAMLPSALLLSGCAEAIVGNGPPDSGLADFESAWKTVHDVYPYFQFKKINWDSIHAVYLPRRGPLKGTKFFRSSSISSKS